MTSWGESLYPEGTGAPLMGHRSQTWQMDTGNKVGGTRRIRLIHGMDSWWGRVYRGLYKQQPPLLRSYARGSRPFFRREASMMTSRIVAWRLLTGKLPFRLQSYELLNRIADQGYGLDLAYLFRHRQASLAAHIGALDGSITVLAGSGGFMSDSNAPDEFLQALLATLVPWRMHEMHKALLFYTRDPRCPARGLPHDLGIVACVDVIL